MLGEIKDLSHVKHLALLWDHIISGLQFKMPIVRMDGPSMPRWLTSEALESVTFVIEFDKKPWYEEKDRATVFYEPEESRWQDLMNERTAGAYAIGDYDWVRGSHLTPAETKAEVTRILEVFKKIEEQAWRMWKVPRVEVQAITHDRGRIGRRRNDFWIPARN